MKLGPYAHQAIFMDYPKGVKDYRVWDVVNKVFFVTRDIEFNGGVPGLHSSFNSDSNDEEEDCFVVKSSSLSSSSLTLDATKTQGAQAVVVNPILNAPR